MGGRNGTGPPVDVAKQLARVKPGGGITPEVVAFLERRTEGFQRATSGKGKPMTYGMSKAKTP